MKKEALLYEKLEAKKVHCYLCGHQCKIAEGKFGICGVRQNLDGTLYTHVYGQVTAANVDPIEKKPLYHFLPGSTSFSIATVGCNFKCGFCQNWEISQANFRDGSGSSGLDYTPEQVVEAAQKKGCRSISYTYTEPTIYFEYALDCAKLAKAKGLYNIFVTNGYMSQEAIKMIKPCLDAANIDLKFFKDESYRKICGASLEPVLKSIELMHKLGIWVEVTTLIVPGQNDSEEELKKIAEFLAGIDKNLPWHISKFYPNYKFTDQEPTAEEVLKKTREIGFAAGLKYVYVGNVYGWGNDTVCPSCKKTLINREGFSIIENRLKGDKCGFCQAEIPGRFG
jgi:pyruvate formate lyase activating enzyme